MIEYNSETANKLEELHPTIKTPELALPSYSELEVKVAELQAELTEANRVRDYWASCHDELKRSVRKAEQEFREILAGDVDASNIIETYGEVFTEHLGWLFSREVEIEISVTWRGTIELPHGVEVDDLDVDDFGISIDGHHEYEGHINNYFEDSSIDER